MYGTEPRYNEILVITNIIRKPKRKINPDIKDECRTDQQQWKSFIPVTREQLLSHQLIIYTVRAIGKGMTCIVFLCRSYVQCTVASYRQKIRELTFGALDLCQIRCNERLTLEISALQSPHGGQITLSTQFIKLNIRRRSTTVSLETNPLISFQETSQRTFTYIQ